jgi:hypothetical protein
MSDTLATEIKEQIEFYFSDSNFRRDVFLNKVTDESKDGFVPVGTLMSFNRIKALTTDSAALVAALKDSEVVATSENGLGMKRKNPLPETDDSKSRTVFARTFPEGTKWHDIRDQFKILFGAVVRVRLRRNKEKKFDGSAFIEFANEKSAKECIAAKGKLSDEVQLKLVCSLQDFLDHQKEKRKERAQKAKVNETVKKENEIVPNVIVRVTNLPLEVAVITAKEELKQHGKISYLEIETKTEDASNNADDKSVSALARFRSEEDQTEFIEKCVAGTVSVSGSTISATLVQGEEEKQYWKRTFAAWNSSGGHKKFRNRRGPKGGRNGQSNRQKRSRDEGPGSSPALSDQAPTKVANTKNESEGLKTTAASTTASE